MFHPRARSNTKFRAPSHELPNGIDPRPSGWSSLNYAQKRDFMLGHERKHVNNYRLWYNARKFRIETFEMLIYPNKQGCEQRASILVQENMQWFQKYDDEINHVDW